MTQANGQMTARTIRNETSYDDWHYGTEPIPGDTSWVAPQNAAQLIARLVDTFEESESINRELLARLAFYEIFKLPEATLLQIRSQHPRNRAS